MTEPETPASLPDRIAAAKARSETLAAGAASRARDFVHDHPVASVAGGIVLGALIAGALTRRRAPEPAAEATEAQGDAGARLARLAAMGAEFALTFATRAAEAGKDGLGRVEHTLGAIGESAGTTGAEAGKRVSGLAELVLAALRARLGRRGEG